MLIHYISLAFINCKIRKIKSTATLTLPCARKHKVSVGDVGDALNGVALNGSADGKDNGTHKRLKLAAKGKRVVGNLTVLNINLDTHSGQRASEFLARGNENSGTLFGSNRRIHLNLVCSVDHNASILSRRCTWCFIRLQPVVLLKLGRMTVLKTAAELR